MIRSYVLTFASGTLVLGLGGCGISVLSARGANPVMIDTVTQRAYGFGDPVYGVVSTTAGRRSIFVKYKKGKSDATQETDVCAEAPPDAIDAYANALSTAAKGSAPSGPSAQLSGSNSFAVSSGLGLYRSQGLQYLRDQTFSLCMMLLQEHITSAQWVRMHDEAAGRAERLITAEMKAILAAASRPPLLVMAPNLSGSAPNPSDSAPEVTPAPNATPPSSLKSASKPAPAPGAAPTH